MSSPMPWTPPACCSPRSVVFLIGAAQISGLPAADLAEGGLRRRFQLRKGAV